MTLDPISTPPPSTCIVGHAATPVQVCRHNTHETLHLFWVGGDGVHSGLILPAIRYMAEIFESDTELWSGLSAGTDKPVVVTYLAAGQELQVSTYCADTPYDTDKPYVFVIDVLGNVKHLAW